MQVVGHGEISDTSDRAVVLVPRHKNSSPSIKLQDIIWTPHRMANAVKGDHSWSF